jgi:hypothetical protein
MKIHGSLLAILLIGVIRLDAQQLTPAQKLILTSEDSLNYNAIKGKTVISGYGSAFYQRDFHQHQAFATLDRAVLFVGHNYSEKISLITELEVEQRRTLQRKG